MIHRANLRLSWANSSNWTSALQAICLLWTKSMLVWPPMCATSARKAISMT